MGKKFFIALLALILFFTNGCRKKQGFRKELIGGIEHIYNPAQPLKGTVELEVEEKRRFPVDAEKPMIVYLFSLDSRGNVYVVDGRTLKILGFNPQGKLFVEFGGQGEGPGEFIQLIDLGTLQDQVWVKGLRKIAFFTPEGKLIKEINIRRLYGSPFLPLGKGLFLTSVSEWDGEKVYRTFIVINEKEEVLAKLFSSDKIGILRPKGESQGGLISTLLAANTFVAYDQQSGLFYFCEGDQYAIHIKNMENRTLAIIHTPLKGPLITDEDIKRIKETFLKDSPEIFRKKILSNLPKRFSVIRGLIALPHGFIGVFRTTSFDKVVMDVFNSKGRFIYTIKFPPEIDPLKTQFNPGSFSLLKTVQDNTYFIEYAPQNLLEVFGR